ncbi:Uncharacterised protein [Mycobacteroides abscessus subsp. abscessus]|nr:Uncharacterised protein [Mycobacteroides abscessus subsp. abscessus]
MLQVFGGGIEQFVEPALDHQPIHVLVLAAGDVEVVSD